MAKVKIQGHASGSGVLTVTAPNTSTDRTITLPDSTGTLLTADGDGSSLTGVGVDGISSSADATAITIDSSENVGIGASPSGGKLVITGTGAPQLKLTEDGEPKFQITLSGTTATLEAASGGSESTAIAFKTSSSGTEAERMRINSSGEVNILNATGASFVLSREDTSNSTGDLIGAIGFKNTDTSGGTAPNYCGIKAKVSGGSGSDGELEFYTGRTTYEADSGAAVFIRDTGEMELALGNLKFGTAGKGIDFSANSNASGMTSEVLDDYEEGTWTPAANGAGTPQASAPQGTYVKVGSLVTCHMMWWGFTATAVAAQITGLPFTSTGSYVTATIGSNTWTNNGASAWGYNSSTLRVVDCVNKNEATGIAGYPRYISMSITYRTT